jgi:hypothetical protein
MGVGWGLGAGEHALTKASRWLTLADEVMKGRPNNRF